MNENVAIKKIKNLVQDHPIGIFWLALWSFVFLVLWLNLVSVDERGILTASAEMWADWVVHMTYTNMFHNWPIEDWLSRNPIIYEHVFRYPPAANFLSANLMHLGIPLMASLVLVSLAASIALIILCFKFFRSFDLDELWSGIGVTLFIFNGGLGFWYFFSGATESATNFSDMGIVIQNFVKSEFVPQRSILFAAPFFLGAVILVRKALTTQEPKIASKYMIIAGLLCNLIILGSMHTYISFVILCFFSGLMTFKQWKTWLPLLITAAVTNAITYLFYYGPNEVSGFVQFAPGELVNYSKKSLPWFIWVNYGLLAPIFVAAFIYIKAWRQPMLIGGLAVFAIGYLIQFQPWIWDNTKILTWGFLLLLVPILQCFQNLWYRHWSFKGLLTSVILVSSLSGAIDFWQLIKPDKREYTMFSQEEISLAKKFAGMTLDDALVLTHTGHNNWVYTLASRQVYLGYEGWLWTWGLNVDTHRKNRNAMFKGDFDLMREIGIDYVVISKHHDKKSVDLDKFSHLKPFIQSRNYAIYSL